MYKSTFRAMGSQIEVFITSETEEALELIRQVPKWFEEWEQCLSRFRLDSELSQFNRQSGQPVEVSQTLWDVLMISLQAEEESNGLVTPAILEALEYTGYDRSFELLEFSAYNHLSYGPIPKLEEISLDPSSRTVMLPEGLRLDFGGSAKGWAAHQAMQRLFKISPALVNAGGDIAIGNSTGKQQLWKIDIQDPFTQDGIIASASINKGGIATSGIDYRKWKQGDQYYAHIIDPRTGTSVQNDVISTTIIAENVIEAEMAAKTTLLLGSYEGMNWLNKRPQLAGLMVLENMNIIQTDNMNQYLGNKYGREFTSKPIFK